MIPVVSRLSHELCDIVFFMVQKVQRKTGLISEAREGKKEKEGERREKRGSKGGEWAQGYLQRENNLLMS